MAVGFLIWVGSLRSGEGGSSRDGAEVQGDLGALKKEVGIGDEEAGVNRVGKSLYVASSLHRGRGSAYDNDYSVSSLTMGQCLRSTSLKVPSSPAQKRAEEAVPETAVLEDEGKAAVPMTSLTRLRSFCFLSFTPYTHSPQPLQPQTLYEKGPGPQSIQANSSHCYC